MSQDNVTKVESLIIGAGMSGLACGLRLSLYQKSVLIVEKHSVSGGLNSYYQRPNPNNRKEKIKFDVGLHALTNFSPPGKRKAPLNKLLRQLKISRDELNLVEQKKSLISFNSINSSNERKDLEFNNNIDLLRENIQKNFPHEIDHFETLLNEILHFDELSFEQKEIYTREHLNNLFNSALLVEMILMPVLIYGSSWENDIIFSQFVIMFKALFLEGFSRPKNGVRDILCLLEKRIQESENIELRYRAAVKEILIQDNKAIGVTLKSGEKILANKIFSSAGLVETYNLIHHAPLLQEKNPMDKFQGKLSFVEVIFVLKEKMKSDFPYSIIFMNEKEDYDYHAPQQYVDKNSAVLCFPDNFQVQDDNEYSQIRVTMIANYEKFKQLKEQGVTNYKEQKNEFSQYAFELVQRYYPLHDNDILMVDTFSPLTVEKYTGHTQGCVYGATKKLRDGKTDFQNLFLMGTDQGFLGIIGAMLSGISMANYHGLMGEQAQA